jgi:hypothetical protein
MTAAHSSSIKRLSASLHIRNGIRCQPPHTETAANADRQTIERMSRQWDRGIVVSIVLPVTLS